MAAGGEATAGAAGGAPADDVLSLLAREDPEYLEAFKTISGVVFGPDRTLPLKDRALIHLACISGWGGLTARQDVQRALEAGASRREIEEATEVSVLASALQSARYTVDGLKALVPGEQIDAERLRVVRELRERVFGPDRAVSPKLAALIHLACCCRVKGPAVVDAVGEAFGAGAGRREVLEAIETAILSCGAQGVRYGVDALVAAAGRVEGETSAFAMELDRDLGWLHPFEAVLDVEDPVFFRGLAGLLRVNYGRESALPLKYRMLMNVALGCGRQAPGLPVHMRRILGEGTTTREIVEAIGLGSIIFGIPAAAHGGTALAEVLQQLGSPAEGDFLSLLGREDPEYLAAFTALLSLVFGPDRTLPLKDRALIHLACISGWGGLTARQDVQRALEAGAGRQEIDEATEISVLASAFQSARYAVDALDALVPGEQTDARQLPVARDLRERIFGPDRAIPPKVAALIYLGCCCRILGPAAADGVAAAFEAGAGRREVLEAIETTILGIGGQPIRYGIDALVARDGAVRGEASEFAREQELATGWMHPFQLLLDREDPAYFRALADLLLVGFGREAAIPRKYGVLTLIALQAGRQGLGLPVHMRRALRQGTTTREILEAVELASIKFATPAVMYGVKTLATVLSE